MFYEQNDIDHNTVYELIQSHGRTDMYLYFATAIGDFERVIEHWIIEEEWLKAIESINRQVCISCCSIYIIYLLY